MKCTNCGVELYDDARKCPFCKETLVQGTINKFDGENSDFDMTYNTTTDQVDVIRNTVEEDAKAKRRTKRHKRRRGARKNSVRANRRKRTIAKAIIRFIYALILILIVIYNNAPALKTFRTTHNIKVIIDKFRKTDPSHRRDDEAKWDRVPTKIEMNEILSVDIQPTSSTVNPDKKEGK